MGREIVGMVGTATTREIGWRCDDEAPNGRQLLGDQSGVLQHRDAQGRIEAVADQVDLLVARMQIDGDVGIKPEEVGQDRCHPARPEGHWRRQPDEPARAPRRFKRDIFDVFGLGIDASGPVGEPATEIGQR
jgi:hypothetical protein